MKRVAKALRPAPVEADSIKAGSMKTETGRISLPRAFPTLVDSEASPPDITRKFDAGKYPLRNASLASVTLALTLGMLLLISLLGFLLLDAGIQNLPKAVGRFFSDISLMISAPAAVHFGLGDALRSLLLTLCLGFLTTLIGACFALFFGLPAARNLGIPIVSAALKGFVAFIRAVPTVLWVLIFAIGAGLGSVAAIVGMSFHSFGYLLKAYSESFEEIDGETIEALRASGATWLQIVTQAVLPSSMGRIISWTFMRFEMNFTNAVAMGAAAGAGGIGFDLFMASGFYLNLREVGFITWLILIVAIVLEAGAMRLKLTHRVQR